MARRLAVMEERADRHHVVDRGELESAQDRIELLRQALDDLERERATGELSDLAQAFDWLHRHAAEVAEVRLEPGQRTTTRSVGSPSPRNT